MVVSNVQFVRLATKTKKVHEIFIVNRLTNVSQGSVETYARSGGVFNKYSTTNLPRNLAVTKIENRLRFDRVMVMSLWPYFLAHPICLNNALLE